MSTFLAGGGEAIPHSIENPSYWPIPSNAFQSCKNLLIPKQCCQSPVCPLGEFEIYLHSGTT